MAWVWDEVNDLREHLEHERARRKERDGEREKTERLALERARRKYPEREEAIQERHRLDGELRKLQAREDNAALREFRRVRQAVRRPPKRGPLPESARKVRVYVIVEVLCTYFEQPFNFAIETLAAVLAEPWRDLTDPDSNDDLSDSAVKGMYYEGRRILGF